MASVTPAGEELFDDFFINHLHNFNSKSDTTANRKAIADEYYRSPDKKMNILSRVEDQCQWLRPIGYTDVDCFFKAFELALFGLRKAYNKANSADAKIRTAD